MHSKQLVQLAALLATESSVIVEGTLQLPERALEEYWISSKCRLQEWTSDIARFHQEMKWASSSQKAINWGNNWKLFEEVLVSEVLTRVFGSVLVTIDDTLGIQEYSPIARSVLLGHLEARNRVLRILANVAWADEVHSDHLNKLRRQAERWSDMLLAYQISGRSPGSHGTGEHGNAAYEFAFSCLRVEGFSKSLSALPQRPILKRLFALAIERWTAQLQSKPSQANLNERIGSAALACLVPSLFHATGQLASAWQVRMTRSSEDAMGMIGQLLDDQPTSERQFDWARRS